MAYKDPEARRKYQREWMAKRRAMWIEENGPCSVCGSNLDLEVDHIDPDTKDVRLRKSASSLWGWNDESRLHELSKCRVLCKECHSLKSATEARKGTSHHNVKLGETQAEAIKSSTEPTKVLAEKYGLNRRTIQRIRSNDRWKHLSPGPIV